MTRAALLLLLLAPALPAAAPPPELREALDVPYHHAHPRNVLDVFAPALSGKADPSRRYPVIFFIHGGTWVAGDKDFFGIYRGAARSFARQGYVAVFINYRLSPGVRHPEHVKDAARAFAWTVKNIAKYGGDPDRIVVAGHSAGGHLATLLVADPRYLGDPDLKLDDKARRGIRAVVSLCGVYRVPAPEEFQAMAGVVIDRLVGEDEVGFRAKMRPALFAFSRNVNPFKVVFGTDPNVRRQASPLTYARKGLPPTLLLNAQRDVPGLAPMTGDFAKALRKEGVTVETGVIADTTHRGIVEELHHADSAAAKRVRTFLDRQLSGS